MFIDLSSSHNMTNFSNIYYLPQNFWSPNEDKHRLPYSFTTHNKWYIFFKYISFSFWNKCDYEGIVHYQITKKQYSKYYTLKISGKDSVYMFIKFSLWFYYKIRKIGSNFLNYFIQFESTYQVCNIYLSVLWQHKYLDYFCVCCGLFHHFSSEFSPVSYIGFIIHIWSMKLMTE